MNDLISRLSEIRSNYNCFDENEEPYYRALSEAIQLASAQPEKRTDKRTETHSCDLIDRQAAIDFIDVGHLVSPSELRWSDKDVVDFLKSRPSVQPTLYGYNIEQLVLIARLLAKENLPPERVSEALSDIGRVVAIVKEEYEEALREAVERCMI